MILQMDTAYVYRLNVFKTKQFENQQTQKMKYIPTDII